MIYNKVIFNNKEQFNSIIRILDLLNDNLTTLDFNELSITTIDASLIDIILGYTISNNYKIDLENTKGE